MKTDEKKTNDLGGLTQWQLIRRLFLRHKLAVGSLGIIFLLYAMAIFAEFVAPHGPGDKDFSRLYAPPQTLHFNVTHGLYVRGLEARRDPRTLVITYVEHPEQIIPLSLFAQSEPYLLWGVFPVARKLLAPDVEAYRALTPGQKPVPAFHPLGTDRYGRCLFSRIVYGARISLSIGLVAIAVSFVLGLSIGGLSGYLGGTFDLLTQRLIEVLQSIPGLPLWIALGAIIPPDTPPLLGYFGITLVLSFLGWTGLARVVRGKILSLREEDYAVAARLLGAGHGRIIFRHLLPGFSSHIIVSLSLAIPGMILGETALSFLGLGLRPPLISWGVLLQDCLNLDIVSRYPWLILPTLFLVLTVLAFNFVGDGLRDATDPYATR